MAKRNLPVPHRPKAVADPIALAERAAATAAASVAPRTREAYDEGWKTFTSWCAANGHQPLPASPEVVVFFLQSEADRGMSLSTIRLRGAAVTYFHVAAIDAAAKRLRDDRITDAGEVERLRVLAGSEPPMRSWTVRKFMGGLTRQLGEGQDRKAAVRVEHLRQMVPLLGTRDRAILLLGFATALRRSNLAAMRPEQVKMDPRGLLVHVPHSKTDQTGQGFWLGVHYGVNPATCPVRAFEAWMRERPAGMEALFGVSDKTIARVVKRAAKKIGLDAAAFSGHSLRAGLVTEAKARGASRDTIRQQTKHASDAMLDRYDRPEDAFERNVTKDLGL